MLLWTINLIVRYILSIFLKHKNYLGLKNDVEGCKCFIEDWDIFDNIEGCNDISNIFMCITKNCTPFKNEYDEENLTGKGCKICGEGIYKKMNYKGENYKYGVDNKIITLNIKNITSFTCDECGEGFNLKKDSDRLNNILIKLRRHKKCLK